MGCDGGTIPRRDELVRTKKKPEQKDKAMELAFRWQHCALGQEPLRHPVVACELGRLYNKDTVIESLLDKDNKPAVVSHIRGLKDIKELKLTDNPDFKQLAEKGDGAFVDVCKARWICPVVGLEMNGRFGFNFIWSCGCVLSHRAMQQIKNSTCLKCEEPFKEEDVVILNPLEGDEQDRMTTKMEARRERARTARKAKKRDTTEVSSTEPEASTSKKTKTENDKLSNGHTSTKLVNGGASKDVKLQEKRQDKTSTSYSVSKDPNATEAYKSLFTTHKTAKAKGSAHWITYNPFYN